jgi:hypothetical protein
MSTEQDPPTEEVSVPLSGGPSATRRGHFFYIAAFFILIALCSQTLSPATH